MFGFCGFGCEIGGIEVVFIDFEFDVFGYFDVFVFYYCDFMWVVC